jgi:aminocarboxymuconate-semialdehyde decarboxylase
MNAVDSHIHWFPDAYHEFLAQRGTEPRSERDGKWWKYMNGNRSVRLWPEWFDLDMQYETVAKTGMDMTLVTSMGISSDLEGLPAAEAAEASRIVNEAWSDMQRKRPGKFFGVAAIPLQDTQLAIDELEHAIGTLDLRGVSLPGSIAGEPVDAPRLEPFYARVAELGVPMFLHPTDGQLVDVMEGYENMVYKSLGRVVDSSIGVLRMVLSGLFDRHPDLKLLHFHAGGVLPYAAGRLDKNARVADLEEQPTAYLKRMWVDTAMPHPLTLKMALEFYGEDRVLYGSDNPCWNPMAALEALRSLELAEPVMDGVLGGNLRGLMDLRAPAAV